MIYLDYNATAPLRPDIAKAMALDSGSPLNPSSVHAMGRKAKALMGQAKQDILQTLNASKCEAIFCTTGTEANQLAINSHKLITSATEHVAILDNANNPTILPVNQHGQVGADVLEKTISDLKPPFLVSVILANNETGVINDIKSLANITRKKGGLFHTDAVQAIGKIPVDFDNLGVDMLTLTTHKIGGPVGASVLIYKRSIELNAVTKGGAQQNRKRAGTENIPAIIGMAYALKNIDLTHMAQLTKWRDEFEAKILKASPNTVIFGKNTKRLPNTSNLTMPNINNQTQLMDLDMANICVSTGSACSSGKVGGSHVLKAMGVDDDIAKTVIRISAGWATKYEDFTNLTQQWLALYKRLV